MKTLPTQNNFLAIEEEYSNLEHSQIVIVPAPYEHRTSYGKGTADGPRAILDASAFVEFFDDEFEREICFEKGIATLEPINFEEKYDTDALELIENTIYPLLENDKFVVTLGGEHTISIATIKAHFQRYPNMHILHFDAHSDLRDEYEGSIYSHACFMARVAEFFPIENLTQVGIRAQCIEESIFIKQNKIKTFYASAIRRGLHGSNWQKTVCDTLGKEVYVTFDIDYFDPSIMPSTGTPEPDGFLWNETMEIFRELNKQNKKIIGFDVVEFAPNKQIHHPDLTTAKFIYKLLNFSFVGK
jgi:agmatinase